MSSDLNSGLDYTRLYLKNVPSDMTKNQLKDAFFSDLENIDVHFPKPKNNVNLYDTKLAFIQFATANGKSKNPSLLSTFDCSMCITEGKLARQIINSMDWRSIQANFATKKSADSKKNGTKSGAFSDSEIKMEMKKCSFCGILNSAFACNDCCTLYSTTFYCSEDHQLRDWSRHRVECKSLPRLIKHAAPAERSKIGKPTLENSQSFQ
jgi:hypothetical protein